MLCARGERGLRVVAVAVAAALSVVLMSAGGAAGQSAATDKNGGYDHRAHAVPGGPYVGYAAKGATAAIALDGARSHSHYFDPATGVTGSIIRYSWRAPGLAAAPAPLCVAVRCTVPFPRGVHRLELTVTDNTNSSATAETTVSVLAPELPGLRAWFSVADTPDLLMNAVPRLSATVPRVGAAAKPDAPAFPAGFDGRPAQMQYFGSVNASAEHAGTRQLRVRCSPAAPGGYCYASLAIGGGADPVVVQGPTGATSPSFNFAKGFHYIYASALRNALNASADYVALEWRQPPSGSWSHVPPSVLVHVPIAFAPVLNSVNPKDARPGDVLKLSGTGFSVSGLSVAVGQAGEKCTSVTVESDESLTCVLPAAGVGSAVPVWVATQNGVSNKANITISADSKSGVGYYQEPAFEQTHLVKSGGSKDPFPTNQVASITIGPDQRYYLGALNGYVHVLTVGDKKSGDPYVVTSHCASEHLGDAQSILGLSFNPAEFPATKLYASVSQLYWEERYNLSRKTAWRNGRIVTFEPDEDACLKLTNPGLVTGLPVSNHDHGVNAIQFDDDGILYVTVGGSTNGGRAVIGDKIGGAPDSPLSGAMLWMPVLRPGFNGAVKYTKPDDPASTDVVRSPPKDSADVFRFADGLRNAYSHIVHSNGRHYAVDNGANEGFGDFSSGCGKNQVRPSRHDGDPLRLVTNGSFQGYANMNRGRHDSRQCVHRELRSPGDSGYKVQIAYFEGGTTGLIEYTSNTFGGAMRSNLLLTKFAIEDTGKAYRVVLSKDGTSVESQYEIAQYSGLSAVMTPYGGVAMPRVWQGHVAVLSASESNPGIVTVSAVSPPRGPKAGGHRVMVTGWNLFPPLNATFGGQPCTNLGDYETNGRSFMCTVPGGKGKVPVVVTAANGTSQSWGWEYSYMNI